MREVASSRTERVLREQLMPAAEIEAVLEADDAEQIRRRLELHAERLQERLVEQLRSLSRLERLLLAELGRERAVPEVSALSAARMR